MRKSLTIRLSGRRQTLSREMAGKLMVGQP